MLLAEAKLHAPRERAGTVKRARVVDALEASAEAPLTLVAAPLGYGKTTAVRSWCASHHGGFAWVNLDARDNDPARLWNYVATAVDRVRNGLGREALRRLAASDVDGAVVELGNGLSAFGSDLSIVLDDFQSVTDPDCLATIDQAIERLPPSARLVVVTRTDPALRLPHFRARGELVELRARELAFSGAEAYELLVQRGRLPLRPEEVELLCERTEGWPSALYLALLWLRGVGDPHGAVSDFGGTHRFVVDYLNQEVLGALDEESRSFLLKASVLGQFTTELCDDVIGTADAEAMLEELEQSNQFVVRLEHGAWFRVHSLFAEFASFQLEAEQPGAADEVRRSAAEWFRSRGASVEAMEHAAASGDHALLASILSDCHLRLIRSGAARTLLRWVRVLPEEHLLAHPELAMAAATACGLIGRGTIEGRRFLGLAVRAQDAGPARRSAYLAAGIGMVRAFTVDGGVTAAVEQGRRAVELAEAEVDDVLVASLAGCARALYFAGDFDGAWATALRAIEHPEAERRPTAQALARVTLALICVDRGLDTPARVHAEKAKSLVRRVGSNRSWIGANVRVAVGAVLESEGNLAEAEREYARAGQFFGDEVATVHQAWLLVLTARVRLRRGRLDGAAAALDAARDELSGIRDGGIVPGLADAVSAELARVEERSRGEVAVLPSHAELSVLHLLGGDLSSREIGRALFISQNTVRTHTRAIYRKLGVNSRADAVARATALGLLAGDEQPNAVHPGDPAAVSD
ncbi:MAG TPA: LuxR C-terminal-related transcriptional regulator [Gaiellaceae bacterium]